MLVFDSLVYRKTADRVNTTREANIPAFRSMDAPDAFMHSGVAHFSPRNAAMSKMISTRRIPARYHIPHQIYGIKLVSDRNNRAEKGKLCRFLNADPDRNGICTSCLVPFNILCILHQFTGQHGKERDGSDRDDMDKPVPAVQCSTK